MAKTFEDNIARLEEIVTALEKGDAKLADSLKLFEEGTKLVHDCGAMLDKAEQKVAKLSKARTARRSRAHSFRRSNPWTKSCFPPAWRSISRRWTSILTPALRKRSAQAITS